MEEIQGLVDEAIFTSPHHPETIGKLEAVNKAIQKELLRQVEFKNIVEARERIEAWVG